jgi:hypothetical protein
VIVLCSVGASPGKSCSTAIESRRTQRLLQPRLLLPRPAIAPVSPDFELEAPTGVEEDTLVWVEALDAEVGDPAGIELSEVLVETADVKISLLMKTIDEGEPLRPEDTDKAEVVGGAELESKADEVGVPLLVCTCWHTGEHGYNDRRKIPRSRISRI